MKIERTKNSINNIVWGFVNKIICIVLPFISRTIFIYTLGAEYLGLNSLFTSILQVLSIAELGFGSALVFSMYKPIAENDEETICALLNLYRKVYRFIGVIILIGGFVITPFIKYLINGSYPSDINIYIIYFIYLVNTCISYFLFAYKNSLLSAFQRNDISSNVSSILTILINIIQIIILFLSKNYYYYIIIIPIISVLNNLINAYFVDKIFPQYKCRGRIQSELREDIKKRIIGLMSHKIYGVVFSSVDTMVISSFLGLTTLAIFNNYSYISTSIVGFITVITTSITASVGNSIVTETVEKNYKDFKKLVFMNGWIVSWCSICLVCLYQHFMIFWVGENLIFEIPTMILMVFYFFIPRISTMTYTYREATGMWWEDRFRPIVAAVVNLITNILLVSYIGINGVIISTLICSILINIPWGSYFIFKNYFKRSPKEYYWSLIYYTIITGLVGGLTYLICTFIPNIGIINLIIKAVVCLILPNILFLIIYSRREEFKDSEKLLLKILNKKLLKRYR